LVDDDGIATAPGFRASHTQGVAIQDEPNKEIRKLKFSLVDLAWSTLDLIAAESRHYSPCF
jgi:hypothetical protein